MMLCASGMSVQTHIELEPSEMNNQNSEYPTLLLGRFPITMDTAAYILIGISAIIFTVTGVESYHNKSPAIWMCCAGGILTVLSGACYWQDVEWKRQVAERTSPENKPEYLLSKIADNTPEQRGWLIPGGGETPPIQTSKPIPSEAIVFLLGSSCSWNTTFPHTVIRQITSQKGHRIEEDMVVVGRDNDNRIWVSAKMFNKEGKIMCELVKGEFHLNTGSYFRMERTPNRLTIYDNEANTALDIEYINAHAIRLLGDFYLRNGLHMLITPQRQIFGQTVMTGGVFGQSKVDITLQ